MEPFTTLTGLVAPLDRLNVNTDEIIPARFTKTIRRTGFEKALFANWRYLDYNGQTPLFYWQKITLAAAHHANMPPGPFEIMASAA